MRKTFAWLAVMAAATAVVPSRATAGTFTVTNTNASGAGSLAQAITDANATDSSDSIAFNIAGAGVKTIGGVLPAITKPVTIDGYTQSGSATNSNSTGSTSAKLMIFLDGSSVSSGSAVLRVGANDTTIRGLAIGGIKSGAAGIEVAAAATGVAIKGCFVGTDASGTADSSAGTGILVKGTASIGSSLLVDRNLVSGNSIAGIVLRGPSSTVRGNLIGTNAAGNPTLGNGRGVQVAGNLASGNKLGDFGIVPPNVIAGNSGDGILVSADAGTGNMLDLNFIHDNGGLSIDLGGDGPTRNDAIDSDEGPNHLLNAPEVGLARVNGTTLTADVVLRVPPGDYRLRLFTSDGTSNDGFGEGLDSPAGLTVTTGTLPYRQHVVVTLPEAPADGLFLSATLTSLADGSTSEFSRAADAVSAGTEITVTTTADSGAGSLRAAIAEADSDSGPSTIVFAIPGNAPKTIALQSSLWVNNFPLLVDGYSQAGSVVNARQDGTDAKPGIELDGSALASGPVLGASETPVILRGLSVVHGPEDGIWLGRSGGSVVEGCFAGVRPDRDTRAGNAGYGIELFESNNVRIGGTFVGERNLVGANEGGGLLLGSAEGRVINSLIGTLSLGNGGAGIEAAGDASVIGGDDADFFNSIVGNGGDGVLVDTASAGNQVIRNSIHDNDGLGIDLAGGVAGVTPNDVDDADTGANARQNFPVLTSVVAEPGVLTVEGSLDVPAARKNSSYRLQLYWNPACDPSGNGEGKLFVAATDVFIDNAETFSALLSADVPTGVLAATIIDPETGNTSEFSACRAVTGTIPQCGDATNDGKILAGDALSALKTAVGSGTCALCACDVNSSGTTTSSDALLILKKAVAQPVNLACPACS